MANIDVLTLSLKDVKAQIDALRASMVGLDQDSAEYKVTCAQVVAQQQKLEKVLSDTKSTANAAEGSYNALQRELTNLRTQWKATTDETKRAQLGQQMSEVNARLKELDASVGNFQRNVGNYEIAGKSMKAELKEMTQELATLLAQGLQPTDAKIQELVNRAGQMRDALSDANMMITQMASDTNALDTAMDVFKTGTATMGLFQGAMAALGVENEESVKIIQKLQGTMLVLQSITQLQTALTDKGSKTYQFLNAVLVKLGLTKATVTKTTQAQTVAEGQLTVAETANATATKGAAAANTALATAEGAATAGAIALKVALMAIGIGVITAAIGGLISVFEKVVGLLSDTSEKARDLTEAFEGVKNASDALYNASQNVNKFLKDAGYISETTELTLNYYAAIKQLKEDMVEIGHIFQENKENLSEYNTEEKAAYETARSMHNELIELSKTEEGRKKAVKELGGEYKKNSKTIETLTSKLESLKDQESDEAIRLKDLIVVLKAANREYEDLGNTISAKAAEDKKAEEEQKKREEEAEKRREAARRAAEAARRKEEKAQRDRMKMYDAELKAIRDEGDNVMWMTKWQQRLDNLRGKTNYLTNLNNELDALKKESEIYKEVIGMLEQMRKDTRLSVADRTKAQTEYYAYLLKLTQNDAEQRLNIEAQRFAKERYLLDSEMKVTEGKLRRQLESYKMIFNEGMSGVEPVTNLFKIDDKTLNAMDVNRRLAETFKWMGEYSKSQNFWNQYFLIGEENKINNIANDVKALNEKIYNESSKETSNKENLQLMNEQTLAEYMSFLKRRLDAEKTYGEELKGVVIERESERTRVEIEANKRTFDAQSALQQQHIENLKNQMQSFLDMGGASDSEQYLNMQAELLSEEQKLQESYTDYYIKQSELRMKQDEEETKERKQSFKIWGDATMQFSKSFGKLMGAVADIKEQNIQQDYEQGKISEEQAKDEFERVKKMRIAELWMTTIAGAAGAFLNDMGAYPFPMNAIIAATDFATSMALGVAQTREIKKQEFNGGGGGGSAASTPSVTPVGVSPLLNEELDSSLASQINTEMNTFDRGEQRVYVLESDILSAGRLTEVRQSETTF